MIDLSIPGMLRDKETRSQMDSYMQGVHEACWQDLGVHCKQWLPDHFRAPYTSLHASIIDHLNGVIADQRTAYAKGSRNLGRRVVILGPRGTAKSSFTVMGLGSRAILYGSAKFVPIITKAHTNSVFWSDQLRKSLATSQSIRKEFGNIRTQAISETADGEGLDEAFGKETWIGATPYGKCAIVPRGAGQQVRGLNIGGFRPDLPLCDDIDDMDWLRNPDLIKKYHDEWFPGDVEYCVSQYEAERIPWMIVVTDTCKGEEALAEKLSHRPEWETLRIRVCDEDFKTECADFKSQETLDMEVAKARANGTINVFAREMMSEPSAEEGKPFPRSLIDKFYDPETEDFDSPNQETFVMMDPARTKSLSASETGLVCATVDFDRNMVFFREAVGEHWDQREMIEALFNMAYRYGANHVGVEYQGLHLHIEGALKEYVHASGLYHINLVELKPQMGKGEHSGYDQSKDARIQWGLKSWFDWGIVRSHPTACNKMLNQLTKVPYGGKKDVADCAAYLRQMMEKLEFYFDTGKMRDQTKPKYSKYGEEDPDDYLTEDTDILGGNWEEGMSGDWDEVLRMSEDW